MDLTSRACHSCLISNHTGEGGGGEKEKKRKRRENNSIPGGLEAGSRKFADHRTGIKARL